MPVPRKPSKVDERIKAAEARRAELKRQRELEVQAAAEKKKGKTVEVSGSSTLSLRNSRSSMSRSQIEPAKKAKLSVPIEQEQRSNPESPCQCQTQRPLCFTKSGEFIPGKFMKCNNGTLIPIRQHRPWLTFKRQVQKLFTIKQIEELLQKGEQLEEATVMIDILRRSCSSRHPIQNKFLQLQSKLLALERSRAQLEMRRRSDSISPLDSPKFSCNLNDLRSPGSSMEAMYKDGDGLLSSAAIDEITSRHNLSPIKNRFALKPSLASNVHLLQKTPVKQQSTMASMIPRSVPDKGNNFKTVLSPRKHQMRDVEAQTILTPLRKSARTTASEVEYTEEKVAELLLQDESVAFVSNPYIKSSPTKRNRDQGN